MKLKEKIRSLSADLSLIGLEQRERYENYYCTPRDAEILGCAGVDGIHYCTVPGFGETVFAVSPMNFGDCVHPIARSFEDLVSMLLFCGDMAALEQCYAWDEDQFRAFLADCPPSSRRQAVLDTLAGELGLSPMENTFEYIKTLQAEFDLSAIPYTEDFYDPDMNPAAPMPKKEWSVTFDGGFWSGRGEPGKELTLGKSFFWGGEKWHVPAVYLCPEGIVADLVAECLDEPHFTPELAVNKSCLRACRGSGLFHSPELPDGDARLVLEHYSLPTDRPAFIHRFEFPWANGAPSGLSELVLCLSGAPERLPCGEFPTPDPGQTVTLTHPLTKQVFKLTAVEVEQREFDRVGLPDSGYIFPTHYTAMSYTLSPDLTDTDLSVSDADPGDPPREKRPAENGFGPTAVCSAGVIGVIGGADGPTAVISGKERRRLRAACSSLRFEPREKPLWTAAFVEKLREDILIKLI